MTEYLVAMDVQTVEQVTVEADSPEQAEQEALRQVSPDAAFVTVSRVEAQTPDE